MKSKKELFNLAKDYAMLEMDFENGFTSEFELDELKDNMEKIRDVLLKNKYDVKKFLEYKTLYKKMTVAEYLKFVEHLNKLK